MKFKFTFSSKTNMTRDWVRFPPQKEPQESDTMENCDTATQKFWKECY